MMSVCHILHRKNTPATGRIPVRPLRCRGKKTIGEATGKDRPPLHSRLKKGTPHRPKPDRDSVAREAAVASLPPLVMETFAIGPSSITFGAGLLR